MGGGTTVPAVPPAQQTIIEVARASRTTHPAWANVPDFLIFLLMIVGVSSCFLSKSVQQRFYGQFAGLISKQVVNLLPQGGYLLAQFQNCRFQDRNPLFVGWILARVPRRILKGRPRRGCLLR